MRCVYRLCDDRTVGRTWRKQYMYVNSLEGRAKDIKICEPDGSYQDCDETMLLTSKDRLTLKVPGAQSGNNTKSLTVGHSLSNIHRWPCSHSHLVTNTTPILWNILEIRFCAWNNSHTGALEGVCVVVPLHFQGGNVPPGHTFKGGQNYVVSGFVPFPSQKGYVCSQMIYFVSFESVHPHTFQFTYKDCRPTPTPLITDSIWRDLLVQASWQVNNLSVWKREITSWFIYFRMLMLICWALKKIFKRLIGKKYIMFRGNIRRDQ